MELEPVNKPGKKNKAMSKTFCDDEISENYEFSIIFPISSQFRAIRKLDSTRIVCKTFD